MKFPVHAVAKNWVHNPLLNSIVHAKVDQITSVNIPTLYSTAHYLVDSLRNSSPNKFQVSKGLFTLSESGSKSRKTLKEEYVQRKKNKHQGNILLSLSLGVSGSWVKCVRPRGPSEPLFLILFSFSNSIALFEIISNIVVNGLNEWELSKYTISFSELKVKNWDFLATSAEWLDDMSRQCAGQNRFTSACQSSQRFFLCFVYLFWRFSHGRSVRGRRDNVGEVNRWVTYLRR